MNEPSTILADNRPPTRQQPWSMGEISALLLAMVPTCVLAYLVWHYSVNVPFWDQWDTPGTLLAKLGNGESVGFADFFRQHNESRKLFPRLFFLGLAYLTRWNVRYEILATVCLASLISLNIYRLIRLTVPIDRGRSLLLAAMTNLLIFSPAQYENWLWGIQIIVFVPIWTITSCLLIAQSQRRMETKLLLCCLLAVLSTFSYANGLLCWIAFLPGLMIAPGWTMLKRKGVFLTTWLVAFLTNIRLYFYQYTKPEAHPSFLDVLANPWNSLLYFRSFLGAPLSGGSLSSAMWIGLGLIGLFVGLSLYLLRRSRHSRTSLRSTLVWIIIGLYTITSALITTAGRVGFGVDQSLSPRYTTFAVYLIVAIVCLAVLASLKFPLSQSEVSTNAKTGLEGDDQRRSTTTMTSSLRTDVATAIITPIIVLHLLAFAHSVDSMKIWWRDRLEARTCLQFINFVDDSCAKRLLNPDVVGVKQRQIAIQKLGFLQTKMATTPIIQLEKGADLQSYGGFDVLKSVAGDRYEVSGWAVLPKRNRAADTVVLTYQDLQGNFRVFAIASVRDSRPDVAKVMKNSSYSKSGWTTTFSTKALPGKHLKITAWAFDTEANQPFMLSGHHVT